MSHQFQRHIRLLTVVAALLFISAIKTYHWHNTPYLGDESWTVQLGLQKSTPELVQHIALYEYVAMPASWLTLKGITALVGHMEEPVRHMQFLFVLVGLAWLYQLGKMLYSHQTGLLAMLILAFSPLFFIQAPQARTYAHVLFVGSGMMLFFVRWLHTRKATDALAYVMLGIFGVYAHQYVVYLVIGQALAFVISVKYDWRRLVGGFTLFAYIAIALLVGWGLVFVSIFVMPTTSEGIGYAISPEIGILAYLQEALTNQLVATSLLAPLLIIIGMWIPTRPQHQQIYRKPFSAQFLIIGLAVVLIAWLVNQYAISNLTYRNLIIAAPAFALLIAALVGKVKVHGAIQMLVIVPLFIIHLTPLQIQKNFQRAQFFTQTSQTLGSYHQEGTGYVVNHSLWMGIHSLYYMIDRIHLNPQNIFFVMTDHTIAALPRMPIQPPETYHVDDFSLTSFDTFVSGYDRIIWLRWQPTLLPEFEQRFLENHFYSAEFISSPEDADLVVYRRIPQDLETQLQFGEFNLLQWQLLDDVRLQPCESLPIESFWSLNDTPQADYSLSLTLITPDGNAIARSDSQLSNARSLSWQAEQIYPDYRTLTIPCDAPSGDYALIMGVYDPLTLANLATTQPDGTPTGNTFLYLTTLTVENSP